MIKSILKSEYQTPQIEVLKVRIERGFSVSGPHVDPTDPLDPTFGSILSDYSENGEISYFE